MRQQQRALAEIVEQQGRKDKAQPGAADRRPPEMPHIGIERLGAGHRQHHRAEQHEPGLRVLADQFVAVLRVERADDRRVARDLGGAEQPDRDEPHDDDRAEQPADPSGAAALGDEQHDQQHQGHRQDIGRQCRGLDLEALDRAQHRDRRSQHAVAVEQGGAEQPGPQHPAPRPPGAGAQGEHGQRQDAALAAVVGAHQHEHVFERHHQGQGPGDQRQHAVDAHRRYRADPVEALPDGVERRGSDIAVDDAQRGYRQALRGACGRSVVRLG
jgi:hypothetical protein